MYGSRRGIVAVVVAGVLAISAGCSGEKPKAEPKPTPSPSGPTLLSFAVYGPPQVITAYAKIAANFTAEHPETVVNVKPYDSASAAREALAAETHAYRIQLECRHAEVMKELPQLRQVLHQR